MAGSDLTVVGVIVVPAGIQEEVTADTFSCSRQEQTLHLVALQRVALLCLDGVK